MFNCITGSQLYDYSLYMIAGSFFAIICILAHWKFKTRAEINLSLLATDQRGSLIDESTHQKFPQMRNVLQLCNKFKKHVKFLAIFITVVLTASAPIYILKWSDTKNKYSSHWNTYSWTLSLSYMDGELMGSLAIVVWAIAVIAFFVYMNVDVDDSIVYTTKSAMTIDEHSENEKEGGWKFGVVLAFICNMCVTLLVNVFYILSTTEFSLSPGISFTIRFGVSLFRTMSSIIMVPFLANQVQNAVKKSLFMFQLIMFNNILIPCVVTALTSSNCFQVQCKLLF